MSAPDCEASRILAVSGSLVVIAMTAIRSRVRVVAIAWLMCQVASLSAFVPEECCISHAAEAAAADSSDPHAQHHAAPAEETPAEDCHKAPAAPGCTMSNACAGPGTQLLRLVANVGVLERPTAMSVVLESSPADVAPSARPILRLSTPDAPPPKA